VVLVVVVAVLALALASALGGDRLARLRVRAVRLLVVAAMLQNGTATLAPHSMATRTLMLAVSALLVSLFLWGNWQVAGVPLMAGGLLLNVIVVGLNLAMPVSQEAATRAGLSAGDLRLDTDPLHEPMGPGTHLRELGDNIPVALPWKPQVVSPGDVLVSAGVGLLFVAGGARPRRRTGGSVGQNRAAERATIFANESTTRGSYS
jgi:hypothetical protein